MITAAVSKYTGPAIRPSVREPKLMPIWKCRCGPGSLPSSEQVTLLSNGCLCCTLRTDLQETLRELFVKRRAGEVIDFDRVFIETSGLADPIPVLHTLQSDGLLGAQYRLNGVVTLVDAVNGTGQLDAMPEAGARLLGRRGQLVIPAPWAEDVTKPAQRPGRGQHHAHGVPARLCTP